jgi:hypothetical protein
MSAPLRVTIVYEEGEQGTHSRARLRCFRRKIFGQRRDVVGASVAWLISCLSLAAMAVMVFLFLAGEITAA